MLSTADADERLPSCFFPIQARADSCFRCRCDARIEFGQEFLIGTAGVQHAAQAHPRRSELSHCASLSLVCRRQESRQDLRRLFPLGCGLHYLSLPGFGQLVELGFAVVL